jgi:hypothetical protein
MDVAETMFASSKKTEELVVAAAGQAIGDALSGDALTPAIKSAIKSVFDDQGLVKQIGDAGGLSDALFLAETRNLSAQIAGLQASVDAHAATADANAAEHKSMLTDLMQFLGAGGAKGRYADKGALLEDYEVTKQRDARRLGRPHVTNQFEKAGLQSQYDRQEKRDAITSKPGGWLEIGKLDRAIYKASGSWVKLNKQQFFADVYTVLDLLNQGADPNGNNEAGNSPLIWAIVKQNADVVGALIGAGADVNRKGNMIESMHIGGKIGAPFRCRSPLDLALKPHGCMCRSRNRTHTVKHTLLTFPHPLLVANLPG